MRTVQSMPLTVQGVNHMATPTINVVIKNQYGNDAVYPACETSKFFCDLAGKKTLSLHMITTIKEQGYRVMVQPVMAVELWIYLFSTLTPPRRR